MALEPEYCWNCERQLPDVDTFGVITVIHETGESSNILRRCCSKTCARKAVTWTREGNHEKDIAHQHPPLTQTQRDKLTVTRTRPPGSVPGENLWR